MTNIKKKLEKFCLNSKETPHRNIKTNSSWWEQNSLTHLRDELVLETNYLSNTAAWAERIYCVMYDIKSAPVCSCGKRVEFERYGRGYRKFCSYNCSANSTLTQANRIKTTVSRYGVTHISKIDAVKQKKSKTMISNYGVSFNFQREMVKKKLALDETKSKQRSTVIVRYGDINTGWLPCAVESRIRNGTMIDPLLCDEYTLYRRRVGQVTQKQPLSILENYELRGNGGYDKSAYHIDHMVSLSECFKSNIPPFIAGNIVNLQMLHWRANIVKGANSTMTTDQLVDLYYENFRRGSS